MQQLRKLDRQTARRILDYVDEHLSTLENPRGLGTPLSGPLVTFWRYRIGDYRLICDIQDNRLAHFGRASWEAVRNLSLISPCGD
jgi:mRNA interferase RelE/StbE